MSESVIWRLINFNYIFIDYIFIHYWLGQALTYVHEIHAKLLAPAQMHSQGYCSPFTCICCIECG